MFLLLLFMMVACKSKMDLPYCHENEEFKKIFFTEINVIDVFINGDGNREDYIEALNFIASYSQVNFESMYNYATSYPYGIYLEDRKQWLQWYEDNKCNNLQILIDIEDKYHEYHNW